MKAFKVISTLLITLLTSAVLTTFCYADQVGPNDPSGAARFVYGEAPPWAPPHGQQARFRYQYFPTAQVYYDPIRELFFYQENGQWIKSPALPRYLRNRLGDFVVLDMNTETPYIFQAQVSKYYSSTSTVVSRQQSGYSNTPYIKEQPAAKTRSTVTNSAAPPPWKTSAYGPVYHYKYYPMAFIYFDVGRRVYFYQADDGHWVQSTVLPENLADNLGTPVMLTMSTDRPYIYQSQVMQRYPHPGMKINKKIYTIGPVVK